MRNKSFDKFKIFIFFSFFISISTCLDPQYLYCNNRIYCDSGLTYSEINDICNLINQDDRFVILLTNNITFVDDNDYTTFSENFFKNHCKYNSIKCAYNFAISIYVTGGKVLISTGSISRKKVDENQRMNIINSMIDLLQRGQYYQAISLAITLLKNMFPLIPNDNSVMNPNYNNTNTNETGANNTIPTPTPIPNPIPQNIPKNVPLSFDFYTIFYCIICPGILIVFIILYILKKREEGYRIESCLQIHNHLSGLENLLKEIRKSSPPIVSISKCVICMKDIQFKDQEIFNSFQNNEESFNQDNSYDNFHNNSNLTGQNNSKDFTDNLNIRFACQHIYHITCLNSCKINFCLMCTSNDTSIDMNNNARLQIENKHNKQVIHEGHIKNFIQNFNYIYKKGELSDYAQKYPTEFDTYNTTLLLGLTHAWGISMMMPLNYNRQKMHINNNNYYGNSYNNNNYNNFEEEEQEFINGSYKQLNYENQSDGVTAHFGNSTNHDTNIGTFGIGENNKLIEGDF